MKKLKVITVMLAAVAGTAIALAITNNGTGLKGEAMASGVPSFGTQVTGSMASGDAVVELTPEFDSNRLVVKFSVNTHSVSLGSFNLKDITILEYEGKTIKPLKASRIGGHHSSGTIVFDTGKDIRSFTIRIKGIPDVNERIYEWNKG